MTIMMLMLAATTTTLLVTSLFGGSTAAASLPLELQQQLPTVEPTAGCNATSCPFYLLCNEAPPPGYNTYSVHCGQVDAAPSIPQSLFKPEYRSILNQYIAFTEDIQMQDPYCSGFQNPTLGTCASRGYKYKHANFPGRRIAWAGYPHGQNPSFYPSVVFEKACLAGCGCCANTTTQYHPGLLPECTGSAAAPTCGDTPNSSAPEWCGVCGPKLNNDRDVDFYFTTKVQNECVPRDTNGDKSLCAAAKTPLACFAQLQKCAWRPPGSSGQCVLGKSPICQTLLPDGGFNCGASCVPSFDCAKCQTETMSPTLDRVSFEMCCDSCEWCVATGKGNYTDEAGCADQGSQRDVPCAWETKP